MVFSRALLLNPTILSYYLSNQVERLRLKHQLILFSARSWFNFFSHTAFLSHHAAPVTFRPRSSVFPFLRFRSSLCASDHVNAPHSHQRNRVMAFLTRSFRSMVGLALGCHRKCSWINGLDVMLVIQWCTWCHLLGPSVCSFSPCLRPVESSHWFYRCLGLDVFHWHNLVNLDMLKSVLKHEDRYSCFNTHSCHGSEKDFFFVYWSDPQKTCHYDMAYSAYFQGRGNQLALLVKPYGRRKRSHSSSYTNSWMYICVSGRYVEWIPVLIKSEKAARLPHPCFSFVN